MPCPDRSTATRWRAFAPRVACLAALALVGCHQAPPPPSNVTPEKALATSLRLMAAGNFDALMRNRLPPAQYAQWRADWQRERRDAVPTTAAQQQFATVMQMLTAPDAEARLLARAKPGLARLHDSKAPALPILIGIMQASGKSLIDTSPQLAPAQRNLSVQALNALAEWAKTADFSNERHARKAIALACATARALQVQSLAQWQALDYATAMKDYGTIWMALENALSAYGLDVTDSLDGAKVTTLTNDGTHAMVKVDLKLAGQTLTAQWAMQKQDGHWYDVALLDAWRKAHPASASAASVAAPAPAVTRAAPVASAPAGSP